MLERTFVHAHGIGYHSERRLWEQGADSWEAFLAGADGYQLPSGRRSLLVDTITRSPEALRVGDYRFFQQRLAQRDHWRAWQSFPGRVAYLDIETYGGTDFDNVTVVGLYDGVRLRQFVRGEDLLDFDEALDDIAVLVTFNGSGFDLPVLKNAFPRVRFDMLHVDLCSTLRRLGFSGGLKRIERQVGLERSPETAALGGWDAVRLWRQCLYGSLEARELLLRYNAEDVLNMVPLADLAFTGLTQQTTSGFS
jgi:uncharacterized protein YprB with RNaseH-like and TPR domain